MQFLRQRQLRPRSRSSRFSASASASTSLARRASSRARSMYWLRVMVERGRPRNWRIQSSGMATMPMAPNTMNSTQPMVDTMAMAYTITDTRSFQVSVMRLMKVSH